MKSSGSSNSKRYLSFNYYVNFSTLTQGMPFDYTCTALNTQGYNLKVLSGSSFAINHRKRSVANVPTGAVRPGTGL